MADESNFRRWHDNRGDLSQAIDLLEVIPLAALPYVVDGISQRAEKEYHLSDILQSLKTVGQDKVLALYKSKNRRRSYDKDPELHKLVNYFFVLDEANQELLATELLHFSEYLVEYFATCETFDLTPNTDELEELKDRFVRQGADAARGYLDEIHADYHRIIIAEEAGDASPSPSSSPTSPAKPEAAVENSRGMKIRGTNRP